MNILEIVRRIEDGETLRFEARYVMEIMREAERHGVACVPWSVVVEGRVATIKRALPLAFGTGV